MIDVVIVNWNAGRQLYECLNSIEHSNLSIIKNVIVIDNASVDDSISLINDIAWTFNLIVIQEMKNLGFGKACNKAARFSNANYILFLNPDTKVYQNSIKETLSFLSSDENEEYGVCGIKLYDDTDRIQKHCARFPSFKTYFGQSTGLNTLFPRIFPHVIMDDFDHQSSLDVDHCIGAFYMIRRHIFDAAGGFDERFFVYLEDLDLSFRVHELGFKIRYFSDVSAFHKGGGTSEKVKAHRLFYSLRSRILYCFKHFSCYEACAVTLLALFVEPIPRTVQSLILKRSFSEFKNVFNGYLLLWQYVGSVIKAGVHREK
ncbi:glycosyltransferase family 2 protein [Aeromonas caviae]|uniref:glycosyltransferase family 2 protein n=1 Tax=Aeromonas caviae TaxID=648 RepID=UPI001F4780F0|nr:glycosyltransferase family 2 protein [Aeromonas caviae]